VAYIYKAAGVEPVSMLAKSQDYSRQRDTYVLASRFRNRDCMRLWNDFQAEQPAMARLIVKDVQAEREQSAAANRELDGRLREAERMVTKGRKPKKDAGVTKSRKVRPAGRDALEAAEQVLRLAELNSCNPQIREWARMAEAAQEFRV
jgi:hypothetical protein